jgi:hypothetical protein
VRCCNAQTSPGQLLQHPFLARIEAQGQWAPGGPTQIGLGGFHAHGAAPRGPAPKRVISARLNFSSARRGKLGLSMSSRRGGIGIGSARRGGIGIGSARRGGMGIGSARRGGIGIGSARRGGIGIGSARRGGIGSARRGGIGSARRGGIGSARRGMSARRGIGSARRGMPGTGRHGQPPTPRGPPPASARMASARLQSGRAVPTPRGPPPASAFATSARLPSGRAVPTPRGPPPASAFVASARLESGGTARRRKKPPPSPLNIGTLNAATDQGGGSPPTPQGLPPASPISGKPKYADAAAAQAARHRAAIGLSAQPLGRTPAQLGFLSVLGGRGGSSAGGAGRAATAGTPKSGFVLDGVVAEPVESAAAVCGPVPKLNLGLLGGGKAKKGTG